MSQSKPSPKSRPRSTLSSSLTSTPSRTPTPTLLDRIILRGLPCDSVIGIYPHERLKPQSLVANLTLSLDLDPVAIEGNLSAGLDYGALGTEVRFILSAGRFYLLESAALCVAHYVLTRWPSVQEVTVTLEKTAALGGLGYPAVTLTRHRQDLSRGVAKGREVRGRSTTPAVSKEVFVCPTTRVDWIAAPTASNASRDRRDKRTKGMTQTKTLTHAPKTSAHLPPETLGIMTEYATQDGGLIRMWASP